MMVPSQNVTRSMTYRFVHGTFIGVLGRHILLLFSQLVRPNMYSTRVANARIGPFPSIAFHLVIEYTYTCTTRRIIIIFAS